MRVSVILSTYNQPVWLEKVLCGYEQQSYKDFEIIIADDGSEKATSDLINLYKDNSNLDIVHVWHADDGFRKCTILNKAIKASTCEYLLFSDGDCIPRADFIQTHVSFCEKGYFLSGGMYRLTMKASHKISLDDIKTSRCFNIINLYKKGQKFSFWKDLKCLIPNNFLAKLFNNLTRTRASWNGHNSSGWKSNIIEARGFDERMKYGGEDRELGERMFNAGIKSKQIRYSAICIHLEHKRGYVNKEDRARNNMIRQETSENRSVSTIYGI